jgi:hypothetical protein
MPSTITNVVFSGPVLDYLDQQLIAIRQTSGVALNRSQLLRGIVAGVMGANMDFSRCRTEKDVAGILAYLFSAWKERL